MSVREEEDSRTKSTGSGLGFAAAAVGIGIGVGAALYYFFGQKEPEAGSSTQWEGQQLNTSKSSAQKREAFRERSWTLEQCSICLEVILQGQEMSLTCTHRFHSACILPWLEKKQTCPNCRKTI